MFVSWTYAICARSGAGAVVGEYPLPSLTAAARAVCAGGMLGVVTGLITGGMKCLNLQAGCDLNFVDAVRVLGRDLVTGVTSGVAASAASLYVGTAGTVVCAAISAPA
jgi:hypothetical protein